VLKTCHGLGVAVVARGAGTGLSGGAMPHEMDVTLSLARFNRILKIDALGRTAVVQCGVRNLAISEAAAPFNLYYAPDPLSQIACTIGGNVAENSGGVHCLKYGPTLHNVLRVRGFMAEGEPVEFGSEALDAPGLDLLALVIGSEGMLAVTTEVTVKLVPKPQLARCIMASFVATCSTPATATFNRWCCSTPTIPTSCTAASSSAPTSSRPAWRWAAPCRASSKCVHCGFCTATYPTYQLLGDELDGPRGRIYLIKQVLEDKASMRSTQLHPLHHLTQLRVHLPERRAVRPPRRHRPQDRRREGAASGRGVRHALAAEGSVAVAAVRTGDEARPVGARAVARSAQGQGAREAGCGHLADRVACAQCADACGLRAAVDDAEHQQRDRARARRRRHADRDRARSRLLRAVKFHLNDQEGGKAQMRANIDAWWPRVERDEVEAIVMNALGCGVTIRDYGHVTTIRAMRPRPVASTSSRTVAHRMPHPPESGSAVAVRHWVVVLDAALTQPPST